jgi:cation diffusion facilitator family transporter
MEAVERIAWYSIAVNITVAALDAGMAYFSGSLTLAAETVHNLVDVTASVAVLIGLRLSQRKSKSFPYGLYKVENIVAVIIALSVFFTSYEIIKEAAFGSGREVVVLPIMFVGVVLAAIIPFGFGQYELRVGRLLNSPSLVASGREFQVHLLSSGVVFAALVGQTLGWPLDRVMAVAIAVLVAWTGWKLLVDGMRVLLDASLDPAILNQIREIIKGEPGVGDVNAIRGRSAGRYRFVEAEVACYQRSHRRQDT